MSSDDSLSIIQQIGQIVGFGSYDSIIYDILGTICFLFVMMYLFNLVQQIITCFFHTNHPHKF